MMFFIVLVHVFVCAALIIMVLIQKGRGSGLVDTLSGVESMFGTKTSAFLTRTTTVFSILFFLTCLSLAVLSLRQSKSLMKDIKPQSTTEQKVSPVEPGKETMPKTEEKASAQAQIVPETPQVPEEPQEAPKTE
jgi:preprotein translocase subunit SecG